MNKRFENIILVILAYLGFGPLTYLLLRRKKEEFKIIQSIVLWGWLGVILLFIAFVGIMYSLLVVKFPELYQRYELEGWFISISRKIFLCWLIFWLFGFLWSILDLNRALPLVSKFALSKTWFTLMLLYNLMVLVIIISSFLVWIWSNRLLKTSSEMPSTQVSIYILYDDLDYLPRWIFEIGFFPVIRASVATYGEGSVVLRLVNKVNLSEALKKASVLLLATHGTEEGILSKEGLIKPSDVRTMEKTEKLRYIYLSGCRGGVQKELWKEAFYPAEVIAYNRMTATFEHILWFWCKAPKLIRGEHIKFDPN
ncbi:MAG: hypothetical protein N3G21_00395 [Candidatus Hydrogenedentes bacterium]|nr:hypothetical protein [Candidatus Hydrogenedentota bacterium]